MESYTTVSEYFYDDEGRIKKVKSRFEQDDIYALNAGDDDTTIDLDDDVVLDQTVELAESPIDKVSSFIRFGASVLTLIAAWKVLKKVSGE